MKTKAKTQPIASLKTDAHAEQFVAKADLSQNDLSGFKATRLEFEPKAAALNMRWPQKLLDAPKLKAQAQGMPYTRYVRLLLENDVARKRCGLSAMTQRLAKC